MRPDRAAVVAHRVVAGLRRRQRAHAPPATTSARTSAARRRPRPARRRRCRSTGSGPCWRSGSRPAACRRPARRRASRARRSQKSRLNRCFSCAGRGPLRAGAPGHRAGRPARRGRGGRRRRSPGPRRARAAPRRRAVVVADRRPTSPSSPGWPARSAWPGGTRVAVPSRSPALHPLQRPVDVGGAAATQVVRRPPPAQLADQHDEQRRGVDRAVVRAGPRGGTSSSHRGSGPRGGSGRAPPPSSGPPRALQVGERAGHAVARAPDRRAGHPRREDRVPAEQRHEPRRTGGHRRRPPCTGSNRRRAARSARRAVVGDRQAGVRRAQAGRRRDPCVVVGRRGVHAVGRRRPRRAERDLDGEADGARRAGRHDGAPGGPGRRQRRSTVEAEPDPPAPRAATPLEDDRVRRRTSTRRSPGSSPAPAFLDGEEVGEVGADVEGQLDRLVHRSRGCAARSAPPCRRPGGGGARSSDCWPDGGAGTSVRSTKVARSDPSVAAAAKVCRVAPSTDSRSTDSARRSAKNRPWTPPSKSPLRALEAERRAIDERQRAVAGSSATGSSDGFHGLSWWSMRNDLHRSHPCGRPSP